MEVVIGGNETAYVVCEVGMSVAGACIGFGLGALTSGTLAVVAFNFFFNDAWSHFADWVCERALE